MVECGDGGVMVEWGDGLVGWSGLMVRRCQVDGGWLVGKWWGDMGDGWGVDGWWGDGVDGGSMWGLRVAIWCCKRRFEK